LQASKLHVDGGRLAAFACAHEILENVLMTKAEFDAVVGRSGLPLDIATREELFGALGKLDALAERVKRPKPREAEPALIFVPK
jgi:hypothetical protein